MQHLAAAELVLPPVVVTEMLSDPLARREMLETVAGVQPVRPFSMATGLARERRGAFWRRSGSKAKTDDALIAQSCIDHDVALITRDTDFRHFAKHCGLKLA